MCGGVVRAAEQALPGVQEQLPPSVLHASQASPSQLFSLPGLREIPRSCDSRVWVRGLCQVRAESAHLHFLQHDVL